MYAVYLATLSACIQVPHKQGLDFPIYLADAKEDAIIRNGELDDKVSCKSPRFEEFVCLMEADYIELMVTCGKH